MSQEEKHDNSGIIIALDGTPSHMCYQEEVYCLEPTVENLKERNKISTFKGNIFGESKSEMWIEKYTQKS